MVLREFTYKENVLLKEINLKNLLHRLDYMIYKFLGLK